MCVLVKLGKVLLVKLIWPNFVPWHIFALRQWVGEIDPVGDCKCGKHTCKSDVATRFFPGRFLTWQHSHSVASKLFQLVHSNSLMVSFLGLLQPADPDFFTSKQSTKPRGRCWRLYSHTHSVGRKTCQISETFCSPNGRTPRVRSGNNWETLFDIV